VEVVYALPLMQDVVSLDVGADATVAQVLAASGILARHPDIDLTHTAVGIWGRRVTLDARLREGDRVEIYRPLRADPKDGRRRRAARKDAG